MTYHNHYPRSVDGVIADMEYPPEVLEIVREYSRTKPWRGTEKERQDKLRVLHAEMNKFFNQETKLEFFGEGTYNELSDTIGIPERVSVVTYLHEYAHALFGEDETTAVAWSVNLFRIVFPKSFARLQQRGHMLVRAEQPLLSVPPVEGPTTITQPGDRILVQGTEEIEDGIYVRENEPEPVQLESGTT